MKLLGYITSELLTQEQEGAGSRSWSMKFGLSFWPGRVHDHTDNFEPGSVSEFLDTNQKNENKNTFHKILM
jgi:hypothetical protein